MTRLVIITVGKTHSGKTTFAKALEKRMPNTVAIDQDNHAEMLHTYYPALLPKEGPNTIKYELTRTIVDYAVNNTNCHVILCNSNRHYKNRTKLLKGYEDRNFITVIVHFDLPNQLLEERIKKSDRSTKVLRTASSFEEVLEQQKMETQEDKAIAPTEKEADYLYVIRSVEEIEDVLQSILEISLTY